MKLKGTLKTWKAEKGFGFITPSLGGSDVFVHISAFQNKSREPKVGDIVVYVVEDDEKGKSRAASVSYSGEQRKAAPEAKTEGGLRIATLSSVAFILFVSLLVALNKIPAVVLAIYSLASFFAFFMYWSDKSAAKKGRWRTKESSLLIVGLFGGWPGALFAQQLFRHKSSKSEFMTSFWATVVANCVVLAWLVTPSGNSYLSVLGIGF